MAHNKERDVEEIYEKIKEIENNEREKTNKIPTEPKFWFSLTLVFAVIMMLMKWVELKTGLIAVVGIIVLMKIMYGDESFSGELSEQELATALYKKLRYKQIYPLGNYYQIQPHKKIQVEKIGRRIRVNGKPVERIFGVSIYDPRTTRKDWYRFSVDLKTGDINGSRLLPTGFTDLEDWDIKIIESEKIRDEKRYNQSLGVTPKRI